ncbi:MAG: hypothetical protein JG775_239 [Defluviitaleaceae bacterium]|nr:hypothetical protein [Defluviitaleaceae bacterium]
MKRLYKNELVNQSLNINSFKSQDGRMELSHEIYDAIWNYTGLYFSRGSIKIPDSPAGTCQYLWTCTHARCLKI